MADTKPMIHIKRVYDDASPGDGVRVLVDRIWPRGFTKREANIDVWAKDLAPSVPLRTWFHKDIKGRWKEFSQRYKDELRTHKDAIKAFRTEVKKHKRVTLLYASKDEEHAHAKVLQKFLSQGKA
jgi:uncharacterized protein YeaO (DUF488 family)